MAITNRSIPNGLSPVYNPLNFILLSDNIGQQNFKYVFEIVVGGETITVKQSPRPDGYAYLDVHRIAENFVSYDFDPATSGFALNTNSWATLVVNIYEEYGSTPATHFIEAHTITPFNAFLETNYQWSKWMITEGDYLVGGGVGKFLTNSPRTLTIGNNQKAYLHFINQLTAINTKIAGFKMIVKSYNSSNALIESITINTPYNEQTTTNLFQRVAVGSADILPLLSATPAFYTVQLYSNFITPSWSSELFTFLMDTDCTRYETYRFHFLNQLGGFDAFNFKCKDTITTDIAASTFERVPGTFSSSGFVYNDIDRGIITSNLEYTDNITVESDWVSDAEAVWLKELLTSPVVFWENENGEFTPITISVTNYETKKSGIAEKLHNIQIQFELLKQNRQRF